MARIVIAGAGYAGMMAATGLDHISEPFTLVNNQEYHYFTTLLHEAVGSRASPMNYTVPIRTVLRQDTSQLVVDEVVSLNRERRILQGRQGEYPYDYLILSLGWIPEYFGIPGMKEHSLVLRNIGTALQIRRHIEQQFRMYTQTGEKKFLRIVVGGGGLTGIELMGELLEWLPQLCAKYDIPWSEVDLQNIEALPTILPQMDPSLREVATQTLIQKGARLRTHTKLVRVEEGTVYLEGGEVVKSATLIWTGGVRANPLLTESGFTVDGHGRARVNEYLQSVDDERVFVGGDCAWAEDDQGERLPPTAQVAIQMGHWLAHNVVSAVHGEAMQTFHANFQGTLASLGSEVGVGNVGKIPVRGVLAGWIKEATQLKYLWELGGLRLAVDKTGELIHLF